MKKLLHIQTLYLSIAVFGLAALGFFVQQHVSTQYGSISPSPEIGLAELSPSGEEGGYAVPASGGSLPNKEPICVVNSTKTVEKGDTAQVNMRWNARDWTRATDVLVQRCNQNGKQCRKIAEYSVGGKTGDRRLSYDTSKLKPGTYIFKAIVSFRGLTGYSYGHRHVVTLEKGCQDRTTITNSKPDLLGTVVPLGTLERGTAYSIRYGAKNVGNIGTGGGFDTTLYFDYGRDGWNGTDGDFKVTYRRNGALGKNVSAAFVNQISFPKSGLWKFRALADSSKEIKESAENNNYSDWVDFQVEQTEEVVPDPDGGDGTTDTSTGGSGDTTNARVTLTVNPTSVRALESSTLTWSIGTNDPSGCTLIGPGVTLMSLSSAEGSTEAVIEGESTYTLQCGTESDIKTIKLIPNVYES